MSDEKTEEPTAKKLRDARKQGQAAQSKDVASTAILMAVCGYFLVRWPTIQGQLVELIGVPAQFYGRPFDAALAGVTSACIQTLASIVLPIIAIAAFAGMTAGFAQVGPLLVFEPVKPDPKKINPMDKLKQMFSKKNLFELIKSMAKVAVLVWAIWHVFTGAMEALVRAPQLGIAGVWSVFKTVLVSMMQWVIAAYFILSALDWWMQRRQFRKQLMMSKEEVKREYKESEGDPHVKGHRKRLHQELVMGETASKVKKATVLVTNPTHKAVALYYAQGETQLPIILAKGEGTLAHQMIEIARDAGVPIMQNIPLARALFGQGRLDDYIPTELLEPVAEVLRWVRSLQSENQN